MSTKKDLTLDHIAADEVAIARAHGIFRSEGPDGFAPDAAALESPRVPPRNPMGRNCYEGGSRIIAAAACLALAVACGPIDTNNAPLTPVTTTAVTR